MMQMAPDQLVLHGIRVPEPAEPMWFSDCLGSEPRHWEPSQRPPPGHRNNRRHIFDGHGLVVLEWHSSGWVVDVSTLLGEPMDRAPWHPVRCYEGQVWVNDVVLHAGMRVNDLPMEGEWSFTWRQALSMAIARSGDHSVTLMMQPASDTFELFAVHYGYGSPQLRAARARQD